MLDLPL